MSFKKSYLFLLFLVLSLLLSPSLEAQRMSHRNVSKGRATTTQRGGSINGGAHPSTSRFQNVDRSKINQDNLNKAKISAKNIDRDAAKANYNNMDPTKKMEAKNRVGNNTNIGNDVNIGSNNRDVNINIDNSIDINRNVNVVRRSPVRYTRPPYTYGGFHFYCHFGYHYYPYRPYYYGPYYHPWGFFLATLTATAIIVSVNNATYHYDQGVFYEEQNDGYVAVEAPEGAVVAEIPSGAEQVQVEQNVTNNYYYGGTYYEKTPEGYEVIPPTAGSVVTNLPEEAEEVKIGDVTYVKLGDVLYQPVLVEDEEAYEVVQVEEAND